MKKKIIISLLIITSVIIIAALILDNPRLIDRGIYRLGLQEQVCISNNTDFPNAPNITAVGDIGVTKDSLKTLQNIKMADPEIILFLGDLSYGTADEWIEFTKFLDQEKIFVTLGDDDLLYEKEFSEYYNLDELFYSFDFQNIHFVTISPYEPYTKDTEQYNFLENDLRIASNDESIDWIIFWIHYPIYFSNAENGYSDLVILHDILERYNVDLVLQANFHAYERTMPISLENRMLDNSRCDYNDPNGPIFVSVGTGGHSHSDLKDKFEWSIVQNNNDYGFLNLKILNGERMIGEFITNNGEIFDAFTINKAP